MLQWTWAINFVHGNCFCSLLLSGFLVLFPSVTCSNFGLFSLCWPDVFYRHRLDTSRKKMWLLCFTFVYFYHQRTKSFSQSSLQILREDSVCPDLGPFPRTGPVTVVTGVREGKNMILPESTLAGEGEHLSKKEACHFKGSRNMACVGISM